MLTPEQRLAELRESVSLETNLEAVYWEVGGTTLTALLDAADERDRLAAQVEQVRALHVADGEGACRCCDYMTPHPCPTRRALDGTDE